MRSRERRAMVAGLRARLERVDFPRLKMLLIVALTGGAGFLASYLMLGWGVVSMALRYPLAVGCAYLVFLCLLWLWLRTSAEDYLDFPDLSGFSSSSSSSPDACVEAAGAPGENGVVSDAASAVADADEFAIPLFVLLIVGAVLLSSLWVVYSAPALFAELLVDGALSASLYRKLRGLEPRHWLTTAVRRTFWPFLIALVFVWAGAAALQAWVPGAHTLGAALHGQGQAHD